MKWRERLNRKRTPEGVKELDCPASDWRSCAVGERKTLLETTGCTFRRGSSFPEDADVQLLGYTFNTAIHLGDKEEALLILDRLDEWIEIRRT